MNELRYVSPKEAAKIMGVGIDHVLHLIHSEALPASNVGMGKKLPRWKISIKDIETFMKGRVKRSASRSVRRNRRKPTNYVEYV